MVNRITGREVRLYLVGVWTQHDERNPANIKAFWIVGYARSCPVCPHPHPFELWMSLN